MQRLDTLDTGYGFYGNLRKELGIWRFASGQWSPQANNVRPRARAEVKTLPQRETRKASVRRRAAAVANFVCLTCVLVINALFVLNQ